MWSFMPDALDSANLSYLRGEYFPNRTKNINTKLETLQAQGMQLLVLDLQNNTAVPTLFTKERQFQFTDGVPNGDGY